MTAPVSWTPSAPPTSPVVAPPLVIGPDRGKARRWLTAILVLNGLLVLICLVAGSWASSTALGVIGGLSFWITLVGCVFQMVFHAFAYGRILGADVIAEIGPSGVRGPTSRWERVALSWADVATVSSGWNTVVVKPAAGPKIVIPARATSADTATIRAAVSHFSGGRL